MEKLSLEVSDGLEELASLFADYTHEPRVLCPKDAVAFAACCRELKAAARRLEMEASRLMWNEPALREQIATNRILAEVTRPGSNVALFPVVPRPFSDGQSHGPGGAA